MIDLRILTARRAGLLFAILALPLFATGCVAGRGEILVGQPEVFTRQRLLNRRLVEQQWLEEQLTKNTPTTQSLQGYQDVRAFSGLYSKSAATFDPIAGKLSVAQSDSALQKLQNQRELDALQHQIDLLKLQQQLEATRNTSTPQPASSTPTSGTSVAQQGSVGSAAAVAPGAATPTSSGVFNSPPTLPNPGEIVTTQAKITSIELLRDQLAWRNAVHAALREQELDDTHDLAGLVLYTLKFDLTVLAPPGKTKDYAKVALGPAKVNDNTDCASLLERYDSWLWHLRAAIHLEAIALEQRIDQKLLSAEEKVRLASAIAASDARATQRSDESAHRQLTALARTLENEVSGADAKRGAARLISQKYRRSIRDLVDVKEEPLPVEIEGQRGYYVPDIARHPDVEYRDTAGVPRKICNGATPTATLKAFLDATTAVTAATVFVADPKEQAQNISDVAAIEQLRNMVLSLQATLPQYGVTASNYTEYIDRSQRRLQAILRRPLVVAYTDSGQRFGWMLGPRFEIASKGQPVFTQATVQHSVQVSLLVPGWIRELSIPFKTSWINSRAEDLSTCPKRESCGELIVRLPVDDTALTGKLLAATGERRLPFIEPPIGPNNERQILRFQAKQPADILIRGENLWRNPKVFVGAQQAETVTVLPDMRGLSARINSVVLPPTRAKESAFVDLVVVTSEGMASLRGAVEIAPEGGAGIEPFSLSLDSARVLDASVDSKARLTLSAPNEMIPDGFARLAVEVRLILPGEDATKAERQSIPLAGELSLTRNEKRTLFQTPVTLPRIAQWPEGWLEDIRRKGIVPPATGMGWLLRAYPKMSSSPGAPLVPVRVVDNKPLTFAYFPNEAASRGTLTVRGSTATSFNSANAFTAAIVITLGPYEVFTRAYPGLDESLQAALPVRIAEIKDGKEIAETRTTLAYPHFALVKDDTGTKTTVVINSLPGAVSATDGAKDLSSASSWLRARLSDKEEHVFAMSLFSSRGVEVPLDSSVKIRLAP